MKGKVAEVVSFHVFENVSVQLAVDRAVRHVEGKIIPVRNKENNIEPSYTMDVMFTFPAFDFNVVLSRIIYS